MHEAKGSYGNLVPNQVSLRILPTSSYFWAGKLRAGGQGVPSNGVSCKSTRMPTCLGRLAMDGHTDWQVDTS